MLPLSVMRFKLELMPCFAGCTKQKLPTTSTIPEVLVACGGFHDLFGRRQFDQGCVFQLGADRNDVLRVILHSARRVLGESTDGRKNQSAIDDEFQMPHRALLSVCCSKLIRPARAPGMATLPRDGEGHPQNRGGRNTPAS